MKSKIGKLSKKLEQLKAKVVTKDKVISRLKNQNIKINVKIVKMKGEHDEDLQNAKIESNALKKEIDKLKAQSDIEAKENINEMEGTLEATKLDFHNVNNDNMNLLKIIKKFQKTLLQEMIEKMISYAKLHKLKEQIQQDLISSSVVTSK